MLKRKSEPAPPRFSVVGAVFVYDGIDPATKVPTNEQAQSLRRLPNGAPVTVLERFARRGQEDRLRVEDEKGCTGWCDASDVWEHVEAC